MAANTIEESDHLLAMINTMLVISRAEAGEAEFECAPVDLSAMIIDAWDLFVPLAEDKQITFTQQVTPGVCIQGDAGMLQRAFGNLIDNAIKYTPENGRVHLNLQVCGKNVVEIQVKDSGPGIAPQNRQKIFDRFFREESSRTTSGTGLGLSLAKTIIEQHAGSISVQPGENEGSIFIVSLPHRNFEII
jgi:signal transduction histidine kinase